MMGILVIGKIVFCIWYINASITLYITSQIKTITMCLVSYYGSLNIIVQ